VFQVVAEETPEEDGGDEARPGTRARAARMKRARVVKNIG
jgi:hypothetical protein